MSVLPIILAALVAAPGGTEETADEESGALADEQLEELLDAIQTIPSGPVRQFTEADFAPYFENGPLAEAKRAFDVRQYRKARALFSDESLPTRYLRALSGFYSGHPSAAEELSALANEYLPLRDQCLFYAGKALERLGKPQAASESYAGVSPSSALFSEARFALSAVLARNRNLDAAIEALQPLLDLPAGPKHDAVRRRAFMSVIELERVRRNFPAEYRAMVALWATSPKSPESRRLWERIRTQPLPNTWRLRRAESLLSFHDNHEAMRLARQVKTPLPHDDACWAKFIEGNALRKERKHRPAIGALGHFTATCKDSEHRPQAMFVLGYSQSVVAKPSATATYEALAKDYPSHPLADDALYLAAEIYARAGQTDMALQTLARLIENYPDRNFFADALFKTAWLHRSRGALGEAIDALRRLEERPGTDTANWLRARYWRARVLDSQKSPGAQPLFESLVKERPASWYGLLASQHVPEDASGAPSGEDHVEGPAEFDLGPLANNPHFLTGIEMSRLGLREARAELLLIDRSSLPEEAAWLLMELLDRAGHSRAAGWVARSTVGQHLRGGINARTRKVWEILYPLAYRPLVEQHARRAKLDPDLVRALMREESRFNRWAKSSTGARGLMQLMPQTAARVSGRLMMAPPNVHSLSSPSLNIRLGSAYLKRLIDELGSVPLAVAAYNAGPHAVRQWSLHPGELDVWVEEIPFAETRDYVMRVLASYSAYQLVYRGKLSIPLGFNQGIASRQGPAPRETSNRDPH